MHGHALDPEGVLGNPGMSTAADIVYSPVPLDTQLGSVCPTCGATRGNNAMMACQYRQDRKMPCMLLEVLRRAVGQ